MQTLFGNKVKQNGKPNRGATRATYRALMDRVRKGGGYFPLPRLLCRNVGLSGAAMLMHLANVGQGQASADNGGWVMATERFVADGLGLTARRQAKVLARLQAAGLVEVEHRAGRRFVRLRIDAVERALGEFQTEPGSRG